MKSRLPRVLLAAVVAFLLLASRRPDQILTPQFNAEDGSLFFREAAEIGWSSVLLPCNGYILLLPRLVACLTLAFSWAALPLIYNGVAAALTVYVMLRLLYSKLPRPAGLIGALAVVAIPTCGYTFFSLCCLHFSFALVLVANLLEPPPVGRGETIRRAVEVGIIALSGPEVLGLLPLVAWCGWRNRHLPRGWLLPGILLVEATLDFLILYLRLGEGAVRRINPSLGSLDPRLPFATYTKDLFAQWIPSSAPSICWAVTAVILLAVTVLLLDRSNKARFGALGLIGFGVIFFLLGRIQCAEWPTLYGRGPREFGSRFLFLPYVFGAFGLGWMCAGAISRSSRLLTGLLIALIILSAASRWRCPPAVDLHWKTQVRLYELGRREFFSVPCQNGPVWYFAVKRRERPAGAAGP